MIGQCLLGVMLALGQAAGTDELKAGEVLIEVDSPNLMAPVTGVGTMAPSLPMPPAPQSFFVPIASILAPTEQPPQPMNELLGGEEPIEVHAPLLPPTAPAGAASTSTTAAATAPPRYFTMKYLQGTWLGGLMDSERISVSGWTNGSYTASTAHVNNQPVVWNDRANTFLLQQEWIRLERTIVTNTTTPSWGFRVDILSGSDYRFTLPRGLFNSQLQNSTGAQNLYGVDPIQHYVNFYFPTILNGVDIRIGRLYTPWGVESLEAVSNPLPSRSYAFNWSPPFTHCGIGAYYTINSEWSGVAMLANGNDVYFGDPSEELRFVGNIRWVQPGGGRNTVTLATSYGRGRFNAGAPYAAATVGLATEPLGRNNFNAFDLVYTHTFNSVLSYNLEAIYAYQTAAPDLFTVSGFGTATWGSAAHYLFYTMSPRLLGILRFENFEDAVGERTGFASLYTALSAGAQWRVRPNFILRPELRYDYASNARPFEGRHDIFTAVADFIVRW